MKIDTNKLYESIEYIKLINTTDIEELDFSEMFGGQDLTKEQKTDLIWSYERLCNVDIIKKLHVYYTEK